ncbi:hypothetical protein IEQ34_002272 [Dendrobium chrysotoxum]|uniref:J domain-containing protein n=1 Tax=Dendrobium chrysotoxum TaxID=161865 RepID=A0AAV7HP44_DENCH|nr:hypothetical protein IEQ34_002272 [Dendrobium chrysotoxum]
MSFRLFILELNHPLSADRRIAGEVHKGRAFSTHDFVGGEYSGKSAYEVLGISEKSSSAEIKASFRKLAKETHPDVCNSPDEAAASLRFLQILAAYEILSDSERRVHYDIFLFSQKKILQKKSGYYSVMYTYNSNIAISKPDEVVEWLKWYRHVIDDIVTQNKVATGSGYLNKLESELYSAIHFAYYGPIVESMNLLPNSFEAEERSLRETSEVLHLVSGRYLFGVIYTVDKVLELSHLHSEKLASFESSESVAFQCCSKERMCVNSSLPGGEYFQELEVREKRNHVTDMYKNLELHISGKVVATATRSPPHCKSKCDSMADNEDHINIFLTLNENNHIDNAGPQNSNAVGSKILLGTITGLGSNAEEGICSVYDRNGQKTHVIVKHRTLLVKHMHWFQIGDGEVSAYECRCTRARLPPSKFWLFEPRSSMHDVGGWYVETFGQNKKGRTVLSRRHWDGVNEHPEKRLHPAIYLLALAYRTLDIEDAKRKKITVRDFLEPKMHNFVRWCKRFI